MTARIASDGTGQGKRTTPGLGEAIAQLGTSVFGVILGAFGAVLSLYVHTWLSGGHWSARRYWWSRGGWGLELFDVGVAMLMGGIVFARLSQLIVGGIARLFGRKVVLGRPYWWDLLIIGLPLLIWAYLAYVANFD